MQLGDQIRAVGRAFSAQAETLAPLGTGVLLEDRSMGVKGGARARSEVLGEIRLLAIPERCPPPGELRHLLIFDIVADSVPTDI